MKYQEELEKAEQLEIEGKNLEAAKLLEEIGTKCLREEGSERKEAPRIIAKSIARYILANNQAKAKDLAYQSMFMKEEHPFLSLQIESAITAKTELIRVYEVTKIPTNIKQSSKVFKMIPQNRKILKYNSEVTVKNIWEIDSFGRYVKKFDLIDKKYSNPTELTNYILATKAGINIIGAEDAKGRKLIFVIAVTFNDNPVEIIQPKTT